MLTVRRFTDLDPAAPAGLAWEALVRANPASGVMQSLAWAAFKRARQMRILHLGLERDGELIGGLIGHTPLVNHNAALLLAPEGPVLPWDDAATARAGLRLLRAAVADLAPEYGIVGLRIEPRLTPPAPALLRDWGRAPVDILALETLYLDLLPDEAAILGQMRPKGRYNIRLAARHGVTIRISHDPADITPLYHLLDEAGKRDEFFVEAPDHFKDLLAHLAPAGLAHMIFAEYEGQPLGCLLLITYGQRATYLYGGTATAHRNKMVGYALQWAAIQAARAAGCAIYDFYGYEPHGNPNHQFANFSRFKRAFGGTPIRFIGAHDYYWAELLADAIVRAIGEVGLA